MVVFLYGVGIVAVVAGITALAFGIPVNEFSFGNTLIAAGTTAAAGGLVVIALGVVVSQLQRIHETLATRAPIKSNRPFDTFENAASVRNAPGRIPFPPRPKVDAASREPQPAELRTETAAAPERPADEPEAVTSVAPTLRNPEEPPLPLHDDVSLLPPALEPRVAAEPGANEDRYEPKFDSEWRAPPPPAAPAQAPQPESNYFDAMWPAEPKPAREPLKEAPESSVGNETTYEPAASPDVPVEAEAPFPPPVSEPRSVAILKSGVVDGMGYTLYVDGSIEAELPQGTLRFSSINELRSHLEKNS